MDLLPTFPEVGEFPSANEDGSYTLSKDYTEKLALFIYILVSYVKAQYAKCGPNAEENY